MDNAEKKQNSELGLTTELIRSQKKIIIFLCSIIIVLIVALAGTHFYHIYQWSQFDTVVVDSKDGGNANYVGGENTGGIYNGESSSEEAQEDEQAQIQGNAN